ncbi:MAG: hypothetical protein GDA56_21925 [Hormoscilla sp. GM7CHS1pb]|nr:hypothetical protein [Hormoscilla sp. GM7CHS1pb]
MSASPPVAIAIKEALITTLAAIASLRPYRKSNKIQIKTYGMMSAPLDEQAQQEIWDWIASTLLAWHFQ